MTRTFKTEVLAHDGARNGVVGLVNETDHFWKNSVRDQEGVEEMDESSRKGLAKSVKGAGRRSAPSFTEPRVKEEGVFKLEWYNVSRVSAASRTQIRIC